MKRRSRGAWPYSFPPNCAFTLNKWSPQAEGLVGWWPTLGSRGANVLRDLLTGRNGAFSGNVSWISDTEIGAMTSHDGVDDFILVEDAPILDIGTQNAAISAWIRFTQQQPESYAGVRFAGLAGKFFLAGGDTGHGLYLGDEKAYYQVRDLVNVEKALSNNVLNDGDLHHLLGVLDRSSVTGVRLYVDGILQGTTGNGSLFAASNLDNGFRFTMATRQSDLVPTYAFDYLGNLGEVRLYRGVTIPGSLAYQMAHDAKWDLYRPSRRVWPGAAVGFRRHMSMTGVGVEVG